MSALEEELLEVRVEVMRERLRILRGGHLKREHHEALLVALIQYLRREMESWIASIPAVAGGDEGRVREAMTSRFEELCGYLAGGGAIGMDGSRQVNKR